jgi:chaperone modulatory protein CbpM
VRRVDRFSIVTSFPGDTHLRRDQIAEAFGITARRLDRLVELGLLEPETPGSDEFTAASAARLGRMLRLRRDLGVNFAGAAVIVDLVERMQHIQAELAAENSRSRELENTRTVELEDARRGDRREE